MESPLIMILFIFSTCRSIQIIIYVIYNCSKSPILIYVDFRLTECTVEWMNIDIEGAKLIRNDKRGSPKLYLFKEKF